MWHHLAPLGLFLLGAVTGFYVGLGFGDTDTGLQPAPRDPPRIPRRPHGRP